MMIPTTHDYERLKRRAEILRTMARFYRMRGNRIKRRAGMLVLALIGLELLTNLIWIYYR